MSAKPNIPKPICLQSATDFLCSTKGCNSNPSSKTSFKAITACDTVSAKSSKSNFSYLIKDDKLMENNKKIIPVGSGLSDMLIIMCIDYWRSDSIYLCDRIGFVMADTAIGISAYLDREKKK